MSTDSSLKNFLSARFYAPKELKPKEEMKKELKISMKEDGEIKTEIVNFNSMELLGVLRYAEKRFFLTVINSEKQEEKKDSERINIRPTDFLDKKMFKIIISNEDGDENYNKAKFEYVGDQSFSEISRGINWYVLRCGNVYILVDSGISYLYIKIK